MITSITLLLFLFLFGIGIVIGRLQNLFAAVMLSGIFSLLSAGLFVIMDAVDVAFTEAAVGAGISTVLMLITLNLTTDKESPPIQPRIFPLIVALLTGGALAYATSDMPDFGYAQAAIHASEYSAAPYYVHQSFHDGHIPNIVTTVLASYRGYDTLGETTVVFTAAVAVMLILGRKRSLKEDLLKAVKTDSILVVGSKMLIPYIMLFALYVQFHGDFGPGGGFQAGVIFAAAFILHGLVLSLRHTQKVLSMNVVEKLVPIGVLLFAGTGILCMFMGGNYLEYNALVPSNPVKGQHYGILAVELGVGITVFSAMLALFYKFAMRGRR